MNVAASCLAIVGALLSIFQPMSMPILPFLKGSFFDLLLMLTNENFSVFFHLDKSSLSFARTILAVVFALAALGIWGGYRTLKREGGKVPLIFNAVIYLAIFLLPNMLAKSKGMPFWVFTEFGLWGGLYAAAAVCAILDKTKTDNETSIVPEPSKDLDEQSKSEPKPVSLQSVDEKQQSIAEKTLFNDEPTVLDVDKVPTVIKNHEPEVNIVSEDSERTVNFEEELEAVTEPVQTEQKELSEDTEKETPQIQETHADSLKTSKKLNVGLAAIVIIVLPALCYSGYKWLEKHDRQIREETRREVLASIQYEKRNNTPNKQEVSVTKNVSSIIKESSIKYSKNEAKSVLSDPQTHKVTSGTTMSMSIRGTKVNLRRAPDINSKSDLLLDEGTPIKVIRKEVQGNDVWLFIRLNSGKEGWIFGDYAQKKLNELGEHGGDFMAIRGMDVNLRKGPNKKTTSVMKLNDGNLVEVMYYKFQNEGKWYFVYTLSGQSGWVFGNYLRQRQNF